jgi:hypothetical protein
MKKLLLVCMSVVAVATAYSQGIGTVGFYNTGGTLFTTNAGGPGSPVGPSGVMRGANQFRIGLYTAPAGTTTESLFTLVAVATNSSLSAGRFQYGGGGFDIPGNTGQPIAYQVKAWSLASGTSYEQAVNSGLGYGGKSGIGAITPTASSTSPAPALFGPGGANPPDFVGQLNAGVELVPLVPEPSSIALGLLGLGAIALFRRRK